MIYDHVSVNYAMNIGSFGLRLRPSKGFFGWEL
jgi:hypothetical protein